MKTIQQILQPLLAVPAGTGGQYFFITTAMALVSLIWVTLITQQILGSSSTTVAPIIIASMGAAAVLMFAAPGSPMAKPWAFVVGNIASAFVGVTVFKVLGDGLMSGPIAVAFAIGLMHVLRCQHPPGGATALLAVIGGADIHALGYAYVVTPVAINVAAFLLLVILHRRLLAYLASRNESQHLILRVLADATSATDTQRPASDDGAYNIEDIRWAMKNLDTYIDVAPEQLQQVFQLSLQHGKYRHLQQQHCGEHLCSEAATTEYGASLLQAWQKMSENGYDYLVVLNKAGKVEGKITAAAIIGLISDYPIDHCSNNHLSPADLSIEQLNQLLHKIISPSSSLHSYRPEVVGQLMQPIEQVDQHKPLHEAVLQRSDDCVAVVDSEERYRGCLRFNENMIAL